MKTSSLVLAASIAIGTFATSFAQAQGAASTAAPVYKAKTPKLDSKHFDALLAHPDKIVLVDVRRPDEVSDLGGFPAYLSIQAKDIDKSLAYIPHDRDVVTVSNHAMRAGAAADLLASKGFHVVGAVGVEDYEAEGGKLTLHVAKPAPAGASAAR